MSKSEFLSWVVRMMKTRTGSLGRYLIHRARTLRDFARARFPRYQVDPTPAGSPPKAYALLVRRADRAGAPRVPSDRCFRILFVVRPGPSVAACTRYRGYNIMGALRLEGIEADHLDDRRIPEQLEELLLYDLVVLVRRRMSPEINRLLEFADEFSIPVICDLDDYIFDDEVIPCSDYLREMPPKQARGMIQDFRELVLRADYYTGATEYLKERATSLGKVSFCIPNGLNQVQLELSRAALQEAWHSRDREQLRIGYFSGTLTHHADFRMIAPVLVRLLGEFPGLTLTVAGDFDLTQLPELSQFAHRVEKRPLVDWRRLPSEIARVDINLIPLVISPFTEGKSDLKYYESAIVEVPSVASPTVVYQSCIESGSNGFLARTSDEWYAALRTLIVDPELRSQMGKRAYQHAIVHYAPRVIGSHALDVYRSVLQDHRRRLGFEGNEPTVTILLADLERAIRDRVPALTLCNALSEAGVPVTLQIPSADGGFTARAARSVITAHQGSEPRYAVEVGSEVACCDLLLATDFTTAYKARSYRHRSRWAAYLVTEYEPAQLASPEQQEVATRSYQLGLDLLALDPVIARCLDQAGDLAVKVLPTWVEAGRPHVDRCHEPKAVLVVGTSCVPHRAWNEVALALEWIGWYHPDLRFLTCSDPDAHTEPDNGRWLRVASISAPESLAILKDRPICVVLYPSGRPPWLHDLLSMGCAVIAVVACLDQTRTDAEFKEGVIQVPADGRMIAQAIDSLLIDPVRLGALTDHGTAYVGSLPRPIESARALLREFRAACTPDVKLHHGDDDEIHDDPLFDVA